MKKTLLAMGVLGAFSSLAFAASNVTLYGVIEEGVVVGKASHHDTTVELQSGFDQGSRWGIKGVEELGNGYAVGFILEQGFNADDGAVGASSNGTSSGFTREAFMYVNGGFGKFGFGRTGALSFAQSNAILTGWAFGTGFGVGSWQALGYNFGRINNVISYATPTFGGFSVHAMYSNGQSSDTAKWADNNHYYGIGVKYQANAIKSSLIFEAGDNKGVKYEKYSDFFSEYALTRMGIEKDAKLADARQAKTQYVINYGLEYQVGIFTPMFGYQYAWQSEGSKNHMFALSTTVELGGGTAMFGARYLLGKTENNLIKDAVGSDKQRAWNISAGYIYPLSKRTAVKAFAGYTDGSKAYGSEWQDNTNKNGYQVYLGMRHSF